MGRSGRIDEKLFKLLEINFIKHRKSLCLNEKLRDEVTLGYLLSGKGSELLYDCMLDPEIEVPSIEVDDKRPRMTKAVHAKADKLIGH